MPEKVSKYLVVSDRTYADSSGIRLQLAYSTRTATPLFVTPSVASSLRRGLVEAIPAAFLEALRAAEILVPAGEDELSVVLQRNRAASQDRAKATFILLPASYCNMGCSYCGQEHTRGGLSRDHRDAIRSRVLAAIARPETEQLSIEWFGAEPLLGIAVIRDLSASFISAAANAGVEYASRIVTNGALLNDSLMRVLVEECRITRLDITLDGPPEIHDSRRPLKLARGGSFRKIVEIVKRSAGQPAYQEVKFAFRTNVDAENQDHICRYLELMAHEGFARLPNVTFNMARVRPWSNDVSAVEMSIRDFAHREEGWLRTMSSLGLSYAKLPGGVGQPVCPAVSAGTELISSTGQIFSCTDHPLVPASERTEALGHVTDIGLPKFRPKGRYDDWHDDVEQGKSWCRDCFLLPTCGGSCPKAWSEGNPPCPSAKHNIQARLDLVAESCELTPSPT